MDRNVNEMIRKSAVTLIMATITTVLLLLVFSILLWKTDLPERYLNLYLWISVGIGTLISGFGGGRVLNKRGILCGMIFGLGHMICIWIMLFLVTGGSHFPQMFRPEWILCFLVSGLSGTFSVNLRKE